MINLEPPYLVIIVVLFLLLFVWAGVSGIFRAALDSDDERAWKWVLVLICACSGLFGMLMLMHQVNLCTAGTY